MNRAQTSAIVLLLASASAAYEQDAHADPEEVRPAPCSDAAMETEGKRLRRLLRALVAWACGRDQP
jgi:hypothetical protein